MLRFAMRPLAAGLLLLVLVGCKRDIYSANEANPFYQKGLEERQAGRYEAAAAEFRSCVYYSPASYKAHLQLAVLYDDHLDDPAAALVHYRHCVENADADPSIQAQASAAMERVELRLYESLAPRYAPAAPAPTPGLPAAVTDEPVALLPTAQLPPDAGPTAPPMMPGTDQVATADPTLSPDSPREDRGDFLRSRILATHTVASGDTLGKIAKQYYDDSTKWRYIYDANRDTLDAPEKLKIGQKIRIPTLDSAR